MENSEIELRLGYLHGQLVGLQAAFRGLIACHPRPQHAIQQAGLCVEDAMASGLASTVTSAAFLMGLEQTSGFLLPTEEQLDRARSA